MNLNRRNYPPEHGILVPYDDLKTMVSLLFEKVGMTGEDADLLATILTRNNQRSIYSHGTGQIPHYMDVIKRGEVNPRPNVTVVTEAPGALVLDGDGGLGYFPCYRGTMQVIEKAKACGVAALTTSNHHHYGSAGNYTRLAIEHDCIGISMSSQRNHMKPDDLISRVIDSSPISIGIPAGEQPSLVMDMGGALIRFDEDLFERLPTTLFKTMALSATVRALGGVFAGIYKEELKSSGWASNQGSFIAVVSIAHFMPVEDLKREMDRYISEARKTKPLPGMDSAELAGGNEWHWERENIEKGIPMSDDHCQMLQEEADQLGVEMSFAEFEDSRF
jgi:LDH2 family malate/lactate/ureidoglycolate dehydrogenase